jgi:hypothetical protein
MKVSWSPSLVLIFLNIGVFCSIGQGIRIECAYYGLPNNASVDVTRRVQRFADYGEPFRVGNETLRIAPSPNHAKALVVVYEMNGRKISDCVQEGDVFYFRNSAESGNNLEDHRPAIRIIRAVYGAGGHYADVTDLVRQLARDPHPFKASNETFGVDPYPGHQKRLKIDYWRDNTHQSQQYQEGSLVQF